MKKNIITSISIIILCMLTGCGTKVAIQEISPTPEVQSDLDLLPKELQNVITKEIPFTDVSQEKTFTLATSTMSKSNGDIVEVSWNNYIVADVDLDEENELIVRVNSRNNPLRIV